MRTSQPSNEQAALRSQRAELSAEELTIETPAALRELLIIEETAWQQSDAIDAALREAAQSPLT